MRGPTNVVVRAAQNVARQSLLYVFAFATSLVTARLLRPVDFGVYQQLLWLSGVTLLLLTLGMENSLSRFVAELCGAGDNQNVGALVGSALGWRLALGVCTSVLLLTLGTPLADWLSVPVELTRAVAVATPVMVTSSVAASALTGLQMYDCLLVSALAGSVLSLAITTMLLVWGYGTRGVVWAFVVTQVVTLLANLVCLRRAKVRVFGGRVARPIRMRYLRYGLQMGTIYLMIAIANQRLEVFFLSRFATPEQVGYYSIGYGVSTAATSLTTGALAGVVMPMLSEMFGAGQHAGIPRVLRTSTRCIALLGFPLCAIGAALASPLVTLTYGAGYSPAARVLTILFLGAATTQLGWLAASVLQALDSPGVLVRINVAGAALNLLLNSLLVPRFGAIGAGAANTTVQMLASAASVVGACRVTGSGYPFGSVVRIGAAAACSALVAACTPGFEPLLVSAVIRLAAATALYPPFLVTLGAVCSEDVALLRALAPSVPRFARPAYVAATAQLSRLVGGDQHDAT